MAKQKRTYGSGGIEQKGNQWRWSARVNGRRVRSAPYATREEAERVLAEALRQLQTVDQQGPAGLTLGDWGRRWIGLRRNRSQDADRSRWATHIASSELAGLPLATLTKRKIKAWLAELAVKPALRQALHGGRQAGAATISSQTVRHCFNLLRRSLADAVDEELITGNPAAGIRCPMAPIIDDPWTYLDTQEIDAVLATSPDPARTAYAVAIYAGPRQGELIGLHWRDVQETAERPILILRYSHGGPTKGERVRRVPLMRPAAQALAYHRAAVRPGADDLVFPSPAGGRRAKGDDFGWADRKRGRQGLSLGDKTRAGIKRRVRFHDLRHTFASHLVMGTWGQRWTLQEVAALLGHTSTKTTERYAHLSPEHLHEKAAKTAVGNWTPFGPEAEVGRRGKQALQWTSKPWVGGSSPPGRADDDRPVADPLRGPIGGHLRVAAETLLCTAAAGRGVPAELLEVLGVDSDQPLALRRGISRAREVLQQAHDSAALLLASLDEGR